MRLTHFLMVLLIVSSVSLGIYGVVDDLASPQKYGVNVDPQYRDSFNKTSQVTNEISEKYDKVQSFSANKGLNIEIITLIPDALILLKDIAVLPFAVTAELITTITQFVGLPGWSVSLFLSLVALLIIGAILSAILRYAV